VAEVGREEKGFEEGDRENLEGVARWGPLFLKG